MLTSNRIYADTSKILRPLPLRRLPPHRPARHPLHCRRRLRLHRPSRPILRISQLRTRLHDRPVCVTKPPAIHATQPKAENRFTPTPEMHPAPGLCVTTPARRPVAVALGSLPGSGKHPNLPCIPPLPTLRDKIKILPTMKRASKLIRGLRLSGDAITPEQLCCAAWPQA